MICCRSPYFLCISRTLKITRKFVVEWFLYCRPVDGSHQIALFDAGLAGIVPLRIDS
jgi:hypothetical protein